MFSLNSMFNPTFPAMKVWASFEVEILNTSVLKIREGPPPPHTYAPTPPHPHTFPSECASLSTSKEIDWLSFVCDSLSVVNSCNELASITWWRSRGTKADWCHVFVYTRHSKHSDRWKLGNERASWDLFERVSLSLTISLITTTAVLWLDNKIKRLAVPLNTIHPSSHFVS